MDDEGPLLTGGLDLVRWIGWAQRKAGEDWIRERGLSHEQAFTLGYLEANPGTIQRDIASVSRTSAASVSSLLQGLERRGLVERRTESGDERRKRVSRLLPAPRSSPASRRRRRPRTRRSWLRSTRPSAPPCSTCSPRSPRSSPTHP